ncbi:MAG TPA: hypothetical protein VGL59_02250 [Polyangia bacterium]|jgi:hypothetical protein
MLLRHCGLAICGVLLGAAAARARAAPTEDAIAPWLRVIRSDGAEACASAAVLGQKIEQRLGRSPEEASHGLRITIVARIQSRSDGHGGWLGEIDVVGADGTTTGHRALELGGESCEPVIDTLAFATALILDSSAAAYAITPPLVSRLPAQIVDLDDEPSPPSHRSGWMLAVEGGAAVGVGLLPAPAPAAEASIFVMPPKTPLLYASVGVWTEERAAVAMDRGATLAMALGGLGICPAVKTIASATAVSCLGGDLGRLRARGFGLDSQATQDRWAADLTAGAHLRWPIWGGFYAALGVRLVVPLIRDQIAYRDTAGETQDIFRMRPAAVVGQLRLGYISR